MPSIRASANVENNANETYHLQRQRRVLRLECAHLFDLNAPLVSPANRPSPALTAKMLLDARRSWR